jgi:hypothetical protein
MTFCIPHSTMQNNKGLVVSKSMQKRVEFCNAWLCCMLVHNKGVCESPLKAPTYTFESPVWDSFKLKRVFNKILTKCCCKMCDHKLKDRNALWNLFWKGVKSNTSESVLGIGSWNVRRRLDVVSCHKSWKFLSVRTDPTQIWYVRLSTSVSQVGCKLFSSSI